MGRELNRRQQVGRARRVRQPIRRDGIRREARSANTPYHSSAGRHPQKGAFGEHALPKPKPRLLGGAFGEHALPLEHRKARWNTIPSVREAVVAVGVGGGELEGAVDDDGVMVGDPVVGGEVGGLFDGDVADITTIEVDEQIAIFVGDGVDEFENHNGQSMVEGAEAGGVGQDVDFCGRCYVIKYS